MITIFNVNDNGNHNHNANRVDKLSRLRLKNSLG